MARSPDRSSINDTESGLEYHESTKTPLARAITLSPEQFERLYLGPKTHVAGNLRKTFGNPTPVGLMGFSIALTPLSAAFMGWRGAGGNAIATTTCSFWFGGVLLTLAGVGEFLLGNTFPMMVFFGYGTHFLTIATLLIPWFNAAGFFAPSTQGTPGEGLENPTFAASFAFYMLALCMLSVIFLIGSIRTNVILVGIFIFLTIGFGCGTGAFFHLSKGGFVIAERLDIAMGACLFATCMLGWYLLLAEMITLVELPLPDLPVFDLSTVVKARPRLKQE